MARNKKGKRDRLKYKLRKVAEEKLLDAVPTGGTKLFQPDAGDKEIADDLKIVGEVMRAEDWDIPKDAYHVLPREEFKVAMNVTEMRDAQGRVVKGPDGKAIAVPASYGPTVRRLATGNLLRMSRENRQKLVSAARLRQIHDGKMVGAGGQTTNVQNNVLIVLPHNERDKVCISQDGGNGDGR